MDKHVLLYRKQKLTVEQGRTTLTVTEVELPDNTGGKPDGEQSGYFKRYVLAIIYWLLQYLPVSINFLLEMYEVNQW